MAQNGIIGRLIGSNGNGSEPVSEIIGRGSLAVAQSTLYKSRARAVNIDETIPDYEFYDKLRHGKQPRYRLGGLFARRIESVFSSWVLGRGLDVMLKEAAPTDAGEENPIAYTNGRLSDFIESLFIAQDDGGDTEETSSIISQVYKDHMGLGDQWVGVNIDGSLSVPSPDMVEVERDPLDYRHVTAVTITTKTTKATIEDKYTAVDRTITIKMRNPKGDTTERSATFPNLIGRIPWVHFAYGRSANETNGHPIHESLLELYDQYDAVIYKTIDGAKLLGNPILAFQGMEDINAVLDANKPATYDTYYDKDGNEVTHTQLDIDENSIILLGKGGSAGFVSPPVGFSQDTRDTLKSLFLLLLDHTGIPEFIWGNEISSGRSSSETQLTQWVRDIESRQKIATGPVLKLCMIWLQVQALTDPKIVLDKLTAVWPPLLGEDEEEQRKRVELAMKESLLTDETALTLLNLVDDPAEEVKKAKEEADARREEMFPGGTTAAFQNRLMQDSQQPAQDDNGDQGGNNGS